MKPEYKALSALFLFTAWMIFGYFLAYGHLFETSHEMCHRKFPVWERMEFICNEVENLR